MNAFDTLFPRRTCAPKQLQGRSRSRFLPRQSRLAGLAVAEPLEQRLALTITTADIARTSASDFFIDSSLSPDSEDLLCNYASFQITNTDNLDLIPDSFDVWVKATNFSSGKIGLADDGIMRVGTLNEGQTGGAFFYLKSTAGEVLGLNETYDIQVYDGDPRLSGVLLADKSFSFTNVDETLQTSTNKITSVTYDNLSPVVGDDITMIVTGTLGNGAEMVSFTPATRLNWIPDTFELRTTSISIDSPIPVVDAKNQLYFTGLDGGGTTNQQPFTAMYTFRITASTSAPIVPSPTQFTLADQNWKHHGPEGTVIDVPAVSARLSITKTPATETVVAGDPASYSYTITVTNNSTKFAADEVVVTDTWPLGLVLGMITESQGTITPLTPIGDFTWNVGSIPKSSSATLTVTYTVPSSAEPTSLTKKYINTATVTSPTDPESPHTATCETIVVAVVDLTLDKMTVSPVVAGQLVTYTIAIANNGVSDVTGAAVTDPFAGVLSGVTWTAVFTNGSGTLAGSGNISELIDLAAGGSVLYSVTGLLASSATGSLVNTATVTSPFDTATDTVTDPITTNVNILVNKTGDITYKAGGLLNFTVVVSNLGTSVANGVTVFDALPANVVNWSWNVSYSVGSGPADGSPNSATNSTAPINKTVNLASLGTATFLITALTVDNQTNDITNVATATIGQTTVTSAWTSIYDGPINPTEDVPALILGTDDGCYVKAIVRIIDPVTGGQLAAFIPYPGFKGSVRVASGDVDGDGIADIVVAPGRAIPGLVRVFSAAGFPLAGGAYDFYPFGTKYRGGVEVAVGNIDGVGRNEIIAAMSSGNGMVRVFKVNGAVNPVPFRSFLPFGPKYAAGVMITAGDYGTYTNGTWTAVPDGKAEIAVGTNAGPVSQVKIFKAAPITPVAVRTFLPFGTKFRQGVTLSSAKYSSAVVDDVFVGTGAGGKSRLAIFKGSGALATPIINVFSTYFSRPNAALFTAALDLPTGTGSVNNIYGVQGRGATNGLPSGAARYTGSLPVTALGSWKAPLRIAPIILRVPG